MNDLRPPATGTEAYLAAILDELRALRVAVGDGGQQEPAAAPTGEALGQMFDHMPDALPAAVPSPTKRTRARTR